MAPPLTPPVPPGLTSQQLGQYLVLVNEWAKATSVNNAEYYNPNRANMLYQQMLNFGQTAVRSPGLLQHIYANLNSALVFIGASAAYAGTVITSFAAFIGDLILGMIAMICTTQFLVYCSICLFIVLLYGYAMHRQKEYFKRCQGAAKNFRLLAKFDIAYKAALEAA